MERNTKEVQSQRKKRKDKNRETETSGETHGGGDTWRKEPESEGQGVGDISGAWPHFSHLPQRTCWALSAGPSQRTAWEEQSGRTSWRPQLVSTGEG